MQTPSSISSLFSCIKKNLIEFVSLSFFIISFLSFAITLTGKNVIILKINIFLDTKLTKPLFYLHD